MRMRRTAAARASDRREALGRRPRPRRARRPRCRRTLGGRRREGVVVTRQERRWRPMSRGSTTSKSESECPSRPHRSRSDRLAGNDSRRRASFRGRNDDDAVARRAADSAARRAGASVGAAHAQVDDACAGVDRPEEPTARSPRRLPISVRRAPCRRRGCSAWTDRVRAGGAPPVIITSDGGAVPACVGGVARRSTKSRAAVTCRRGRGGEETSMPVSSTPGRA